MTKLRFTLSVLAMLTLTLIYASNVQAQDSRVYVSAITGEDTNPCTRRLPCRQITRGLAVVAAKGEVVVLDSGDYNPFTVNKAVTIEAAPGVVAGITRATPGPGDAITIHAGSSDVVVIRGLTLNGLGSGHTGIHFNSGKALHVENWFISGFVSDGILFRKPDGNFFVQLFVKDTFVRDNAGQGIHVVTSIMVEFGAPTATASIDHCRLERNGGGGLVVSSNSIVTIRNSVAANNDGDGFSAASGSRNFTPRLNIENCVATNNGGSGIAGVGAGDGFAVVSVSNSTLTNNLSGIGATHALIDVANTTITGNLRGVSTDNGSRIRSFGDNKLFENDTNGAFTETVMKQ